MKIRLATSLREFDDLAPLWRRVTAESGQTSPFLSHDWFACCWRTAGNRRREVWILEDDAGPVALIPVVRWRHRVRGLPVRMIQLLDAPDTPFSDFPVARGRDEVIGVVLDRLRASRDWDVLSFVKLPTHSMTLKALERALARDFPWRVARRESSPYLSLRGTWEEFFQGKTQRFRKTCRNVDNRIRRAGDIVVEEHHHLDPDGPLFAEVMDVSRRSWKGPRRFAMATMLGMPRFFRELTRRATANSWLHLWILRLDGRAIATEYQIGADGCRHALRADFDAAASALSPGAYLNFRIVQALFERRGVQQYDMGPGTNDYKLRWATGASETVTLEVYAPRTYGRLLHALETRLIPLARRLRAARSAPCA